MRVFQNFGVYPGYLAQRHKLIPGESTFKARIADFLQSRYGGVHILAPVLNGEEFAFFTNGDDELVQRVWAREAGMSPQASLADILLAQIESHRTEVFYNTDPMRYGSTFLRRLPGCVRKAIAWRAAPSPGADFGAYDRVIGNFPGILRTFEAQGCKTAYFYPAHDPVMDEYAGNDDRPIDVLFVGSYGRLQMRRAAVLESAAKLRNRYRIEFHIDRSRFTRLAESPAGYLLAMGKYRRPRDIRAVSHDPVFGRALYALVAKSKIVLNGHGEIAGEERGNMRCLEAMGCGSLLLTDEGKYPEGMTDGETMVTYRSPAEVAAKIEDLLREPQSIRRIAGAGYEMSASRYSKERQWKDFCALASD